MLVRRRRNSNCAAEMHFYVLSGVVLGGCRGHRHFGGTSRNRCVHSAAGAEAEAEDEGASMPRFDDHVGMRRVARRLHRWTPRPYV